MRYCAGCFRPLRSTSSQAPGIVGDEVGFINLIQALAHPHGAELFHVQGGLAAHALFTEIGQTEPERPRLSVPMVDSALIWP